MDIQATHNKLTAIRTKILVGNGLCRFHRRRRQLLDYLSAGVLLHTMTIMEIFAICSLTPFVLEMDAHSTDYLWHYFILTMLWLLPVFTQLDARSRFQEFKKIRDKLIRFGPDKRIFISVSHSRCQRNAALAAAGQLGYETTCRNSFTAAGYRWFHLLPEFVNHHPRFLISLAFWRTTFFAPTYHPKRWSVSGGSRRSSSPNSQSFHHLGLRDGATVLKAGLTLHHDDVW